MDLHSPQNRYTDEIPPLLSKNSIIHIIKLLVLALTINVLLDLSYSILVGKILLNVFFGLLILEIGITIIAGSALILGEPLIYEKKASKLDQELKQISNKKLLVKNIQTQGLKRPTTANNKTSFTREKQVYWGKIIILTSLCFILLEIFLEFTIDIIFGLHISY